ncbi:glycosyl hydrolase [SAR202 cluster bacterium AC-409-J13_OGT_754m]|nr:glycosyl hydrolase [SAR202 cluster bacterium AC-409-J13_OGT_754m]
MNSKVVPSDYLNSLEWRCIGPHRGGRAVAASGDVSDPLVFYFGACAGGVWKTTDAGVYWSNISDGYFNTAAIGAIAVSESDPNVIYVGTGESCIRGNVCSGDGVYKSSDSGITWKHLGLQETLHIARIRIDRTNPDVVYVAALGNPFGPNKERGIYKSVDGGNSWSHVLFVNQETGAIDLSLDSTNPRILYASFWEANRNAWSLTSGGPGSGIYKSADGGDNWINITNANGLPKGIMGRIGLAASAAKPGRVWALIEAEEGGLFRTEDGGIIWENVSDDRGLRTRPWYFNHVFACTKDADTVYVLNLEAQKSTDGGRTFNVFTTPHGDNHELWIDPNNPDRMINGADGGACVSFNGGATWSTIYNQPTAQFYHVAVDNQFPYRVYGTQQDNSAISVPSSSHKGGIPYNDCYPVGGSESGHIAVRPDNHNIVYSGAVGSAPGGGGPLRRYDHQSGQVQLITVWPEVTNGSGAQAAKYRFQWTYPIVISPHNPDVLYTCGNHVFMSTNEGSSWECISPDLTRNDVSKLGASGGPITKDDTGAEHYCTIFSFVESPHEIGVFWAGSDDGLIHVSRDNGNTWTNVTPTELPEWALISNIEISPHNRDVIYFSAHKYKLNDRSPYLFRSEDGGGTWELIITGIPADEFTRVIKEDPVECGLLYCGTELGVYVSFDRGNNWQSFQTNLPVVPIHDLVIKDGNLVAATHGRSFWIFDNLNVVREIKQKQLGTDPILFKPAAYIRNLSAAGGLRGGKSGKNYTIGAGAALTFYEETDTYGQTKRIFLDAGQNPQDGVVVNYFLPEKQTSDITITFRNDSGEFIKAFTSAKPTSKTTSELERNSHVPTELQLPSEIGTNAFIWNTRYPDALRLDGDVLTSEALDGPMASPGHYVVELNVGGTLYAEKFEILKHPTIPATQADLDEQFSFLITIRNKLSDTHRMIQNIRGLKNQIQTWVDRVTGDSIAIAEAGNALNVQLEEIEVTLVQPRIKVGMDRVNFPGALNVKLAALPSVVASADTVPTKQSYEVFDSISAKIDEQARKLGSLTNQEIAGFNDLIRQAELPPVFLRTMD